MKLLARADVKINLFERVLKVTVFTSVNRLDLLIDTYCIVVP